MYKKLPQNHIEQIIDSLDGIKRAEVPPFFYTRLMARMAAKDNQQQPAVSRFYYRPRLAFAVIGCLCVLNLFVILQLVPKQPQQASISDNGITSFAKEYDLQSTLDFND